LASSRAAITGRIRVGELAVEEAEIGAADQNARETRPAASTRVAERMLTRWLVPSCLQISRSCAPTLDKFWFIR